MTIAISVIILRIFMLFGAIFKPFPRYFHAHMMIMFVVINTYIEYPNTYIIFKLFEWIFECLFEWLGKRYLPIVLA